MKQTQYDLVKIIRNNSCLYCIHIGEFLFMIDTGSCFTIFDTAHTNQLNIPSTGSAVPLFSPGGVKLFVKHCTITLFNQQHKIYTADFRSFLNIISPMAQGIIGNDVLQPLQAIINLSKLRLTLTLPIATNRVQSRKIR